MLTVIWDAQLSLRHTPITVTLLTVLAQALDVGVAAAACGTYHPISPARKVGGGSDRLGGK